MLTVGNALLVSFAPDKDRNPQLCLNGLAAAILAYLISLTKAIFRSFLLPALPTSSRGVSQTNLFQPLRYKPTTFKLQT